MRRLRLVALASALAACPKPAVQDAGSAGPREVQEVEPNDTPDKAMPVEVGTRVIASLTANGPKPDQDWYRIGPTPMALRIEASAIPGADIDLQLFDQDKNKIATFASNRDGAGVVIPNLTAKVPYFVRVTSAKRGAAGAYTLTVVPSSLPQDGAEVEPNNRAADATPLTLGSPIVGVLGDGTDEDWFRVDLPAPPAPSIPAEPSTGTQVSDHASNDTGDAGVVADAGSSFALANSAQPTRVIDVELTGVEGVRFDVSIMTAAEASLYNARSQQEGEGVQLRNVALRPGDAMFYVVVKSAWEKNRRTFNPEVPYTLTVKLDSGNGDSELEPNDDAAHATPLAVGAPKRGYLTPKGDVDYYVVHCDQPSLLRAEVSGVDRVDLVLSLVKPPAEGQARETTLLTANDGAIKEGEMLVNVGCHGDVFFKVEGATKKVDGKWVRDYENANDPYRITVTARPDDGTEEREPNNTVEQANPIEVGRPIRGYVHPKKDLDLYRLDLSKQTVKTPLKITATGILKVDIGLYLHRLDGDQRVLVQSSDRARGDQPEVLHYSAEPGVYIIEVRDSKNRESNFQDPYQLTVETE
jgi:hypothetical protein